MSREGSLILFCQEQRAVVYKCVICCILVVAGVQARCTLLVPFPYTVMRRRHAKQHLPAVFLSWTLVSTWGSLCLMLCSLREGGVKMDRGEEGG